MFSLIITIISIALVAALALATLYYGGVAFQRGAATADATKLYTQAQQLQGAAELYKADTGAYPLTLASLVDASYLKSIPVSRLAPDAAPSLLSQAMAAGTPWKMVLSGYPVFAVESVTPAVCEAVNLKAYGVSGILKSARSLYTTQCFGLDAGHLTMVTAKSGDALITAAGSSSKTVELGTVLITAPPAVGSGDTTAAGWLTVEGVTIGAVAPPTVPVVVEPSPVIPLLGFSYQQNGASLSRLDFSNITEWGHYNYRAVWVKNNSAEAIAFPSSFSGYQAADYSAYVMITSDKFLTPEGFAAYAVAEAATPGYANSGDFEVSQNLCSSGSYLETFNLAPGASCVIGVGFKFRGGPDGVERSYDAPLLSVAGANPLPVYFQAPPLDFVYTGGNGCSPWYSASGDDMCP